MAITILFVHTILLAWSAACHSPTLDEPAHLAAGISHWKLGHFDLYRVNPPLIRTVAAWPALILGAKTNFSNLGDVPGARPEYGLGRKFVSANRTKTYRLLMMCRWACIPFSLLGGLICFLWSSQCFGERAGLVSLALWCFSPEILAHASLITPDAHAAAIGIAAVYMFWSWLRNPTWAKAAFSGALFGLAALSKTTLLILTPVAPLLWLLYRLSERRFALNRDFRRETMMIGLLVFVCIYTLNLGYGFEGSFSRLDSFRFVSNKLRGHESNSDHGTESSRQLPVGNRFVDSWVGLLPVPLPRDYVLGIDLQQKDFEDFPWLSYLRGQFQKRGWYSYYLYALAIKMPLGSWLLLLLAVSVLWRSMLPLRDHMVLIVPPLLILFLVSAQNGFSHHMRYILPIFPFFFIWVSQVAAGSRKSKIFLALVAASISWSVASSLWIFPHSLSYFNEIVGGPRNGHNHLLHSNIDWSQDLIYLRQWLDSHDDPRHLRLAFFGYYDPRKLGFEFTLPPRTDVSTDTSATLPPGYYAISVNFLRGAAFWVADGTGHMVLAGQGAFSQFEKLHPIGTAGYSIYIFQIPRPD